MKTILQFYSEGKAKADAIASEKSEADRLERIEADAQWGALLCVAKPILGELFSRAVLTDGRDTRFWAKCEQWIFTVRLWTGSAPICCQFVRFDGTWKLNDIWVEDGEKTRFPCLADAVYYAAADTDVQAPLPPLDGMPNELPF